jgi:hypothetical protein
MDRLKELDVVSTFRLNQRLDELEAKFEHSEDIRISERQQLNDRIGVLEEEARKMERLERWAERISKFCYEKLAKEINPDWDWVRLARELKFERNNHPSQVWDKPFHMELMKLFPRFNLTRETWEAFGRFKTARNFRSHYSILRETLEEDCKNLEKDVSDASELKALYYFKI